MITITSWPIKENYTAIHSVIQIKILGIITTLPILPSLKHLVPEWFVCLYISLSDPIAVLCLVAQYHSLGLHGLRPAGASVHGILQARILEWVAMPFSRGVFLTQGSNSRISCIGRQIFYHSSTREAPELGPGHGYIFSKLPRYL